MNFYKHHLGDYAAATSHLSWDEDCAYRRLMDQYYKREAPIPADLKEACRLARATSPAHRKAVETVLREFFTLQNDGWHQKRCDEEITAANAQAATNKRIAEDREARKRARTGNESLNEPSTNRSPEYMGEREPIQTPDSRLHKPDSKTPDKTAHLDGGEEPRRAAVNGDEIKPEGRMAIALRDRGVTVTSQHPTLLAWLRDGFTTEQAIEAVGIARIRKPHPEAIPAAYLDRILREPQLQAATKAVPSRFDRAMEALSRA